AAPAKAGENACAKAKVVAAREAAAAARQPRCQCIAENNSAAPASATGRCTTGKNDSIAYKSNSAAAPAQRSTPNAWLGSAASRPLTPAATASHKAATTSGAHTSAPANTGRVSAARIKMNAEPIAPKPMISTRSPERGAAARAESAATPAH